MYNCGEIILIQFPFTNLTESKLRPALALSEKGDDVIVIGIFSRVPEALEESWFRVEETAPWFIQTGLKKTSVIKTEKIAVIHKSLVKKKIGSLPGDELTLVKEKLRKALNL